MVIPFEGHEATWSGDLPGLLTSQFYCFKDFGGGVMSICLCHARIRTGRHMRGVPADQIEIPTNLRGNVSSVADDCWLYLGSFVEIGRERVILVEPDRSITGAQVQDFQKTSLFLGQMPVPANRTLVFPLVESAGHSTGLARFEFLFAITHNERFFCAHLSEPHFLFAAPKGNFPGGFFPAAGPDPGPPGLGPAPGITG